MRPRPSPAPCGSLHGASRWGVGRWEGDLWAGQAKGAAGLYVDERADERQAELLPLIFGGRVGGFPAMWGGHPLSFADPELSKAAFQRLFDNLDANGIALAGVELGNEINWAAFNPEFPLPGEGKILNLQDLADEMRSYRGQWGNWEQQPPQGDGGAGGIAGFLILLFIFIAISRVFGGWGLLPFLFMGGGRGGWGGGGWSGGGGGGWSGGGGGSFGGGGAGGSR